MIQKNSEDKYRFTEERCCDHVLIFGMSEKEYSLEGNFSSGPEVKNSPSDAGDVVSIPGQGTKIPHATEQLSPHSTTRESVGRNKRSHVLQLRPSTIG